VTQELIYTSAPKGLQLGSRGFCTVACTAGMSKPLADRLEALSGYKHLYPPGSETAHLNPVNFSFVTFRLGGKTYYVLSRIADAGLDHTQRSNKLAHHVVLDSTELPAAGPAWLMSQPGFFTTKWESEPRVLGSRRFSPSGELPLTICNAWRGVAGDAGWAGVLAQSLSRSESYVVRREDTECLKLVMEAQSVLSASERWSATFSTCFVGIPPGVDCRWRFISENSLDAVKAKRTPDLLLVDLTQSCGLSDNSDLVTIARTGKPLPAVDRNAPPKDPQKERHAQAHDISEANTSELLLPRAIPNTPTRPPILPPPPITQRLTAEKLSRRRNIPMLVAIGTFAFVAIGASALLIWERAPLPAASRPSPPEENEEPKVAVQPSPTGVTAPHASQATTKSAEPISDAGKVERHESEGPIDADEDLSPVSDNRQQADNGQEKQQVDSGDSKDDLPMDEQPGGELSPVAPIQPSLFDKPEHEITLTDPMPPVLGGVQRNESKPNEIGTLPDNIEPSITLFGAAPRESNRGFVRDDTGVARLNETPRAWGLRLGQSLVGRFHINEKTREFAFSWNSKGSPLSHEQVAEVRGLAIEIADSKSATPRRTVLFLSKRGKHRQAFRPDMSSLNLQKVIELGRTPAYQRIEVEGHLSCDDKAFSVAQRMDITGGKKSAVISFGPGNYMRAQLSLKEGSGVPRSLCLRVWSEGESEQARSIDYFLKELTKQRSSLVARSAHASFNLLTSTPMSQTVRGKLSSILTSHHIQYDDAELAPAFRTFLESTDIEVKSKVQRTLRDVAEDAFGNQPINPPMEWTALDSHVREFGSIETLQNTMSSLRCNAVISRLLVPVGGSDGTSQKTVSEVIGGGGSAL
jgi:hypothetical protein